MNPVDAPRELSGPLPSWMQAEADRTRPQPPTPPDPRSFDIDGNSRRHAMEAAGYPTDVPVEVWRAQAEIEVSFERKPG